MKTEARKKEFSAIALRIVAMKPDTRELLLLNLSVMSGLVDGGDGRDRPKPTKGERQRARRGAMQESIIAALQDESGPLTSRELANRVESFGYDGGGASAEKIVQRVHAALVKLRTAGRVEHLGRSMGYALVEKGRSGRPAESSGRPRTRCRGDSRNCRKPGLSVTRASGSKTLTRA